MTTELQTYTAQLPAVPDVHPTQVEWIAKKALVYLSRYTIN